MIITPAGLLATTSASGSIAILLQATHKNIQFNINNITDNVMMGHKNN